MENIATGFVEHLEPFGVSGWAFRKDGGALRLSLRVHDRVYKLNAAWFERGDVAAQHGGQFLLSGFRCAFSFSASLAVRNALLRSESVQILVDGIPLQDASPPPAADRILQPELLMVSRQSESKRSVVESWGHFMVLGWAVPGAARADRFTLTCNGSSLSCASFSYERPDVAEALGAQDDRPGFGIELPGHMWEAVPDDGDAQLQVSAGDHDLLDRPLLLSRVKAAQWVAEICGMTEGQEKQYRMFLALEHVRYGGLIGHLDASTRSCLQDFAARMSLADFIDWGNEQQSGAEPLPSVSPTQVLLERALRSLNTKILDHPGSLLCNVKQVIEEHQLVGDPRDRFLMAIVPLLCRAGSLNELRDLMNLERLKDLTDEPGLWEMSLAPPAFALDGEVKKAARAFSRMSKRLAHGWLNTECVRFTVRETLRLESAGVVGPEVAEELRNGFIELVAGFNGEWFSRLHDAELIETMIDILDGLENYRDSHRREMASAAIRVYGLSATFWERVLGRGIVLTPDLEDAQVAWDSVSRQLDDSEVAFRDRLPRIVESLQFFVRHGADEAIMIWREVIANALSDPGVDLRSREWPTLVATLLSRDQIEAVRLAAAPLGNPFQRIQGFSGVTANMRETLRLCSDYASSPAFGLQEETADLLKLGMAALGREDGDAVQSLLERLRVKAHVLSNKSNHYLGADVFAHAYRLARDARCAEQNALLIELGGAIRHAVTDTPWNGTLPQPLQTALSHLSSLRSDELLRAFLQECRGLLNQKFGDAYDHLFRRIAPEEASARDGPCWPSDTLVVIYSCRKYLGTRVEAIRETWLKDLKRRGIPYLIAVGEGDWSVHGDVLELAASDTYEDLPNKTLKLLQWVSEHSTVQYLLKIDDDCYLDVDRYFDSLSYRKFSYYGQVVGCDEGRMDRLWHMSKAHDPYAKKSLDKSPEPSIYAKGGGGYCLSRSAIRAALEGAATDAGARLLSCSYMEDKYVGDLLSLAGIRPTNEDHEFYYRFRGSGSGLPVGMWENGFFPSVLSPTKVAHLDRELDQRWVAEHVGRAELWPKKIWPTYERPSIAFKSNQLELLTAPNKLSQLLCNELFVVSVVRNEKAMLSHFLDHYRGLGIRCFIFVDNCSTDGTREYLHEQPDVVLYSSDTPYKYSHYGVSWQQAVIGNHCLGKWVVLADADEFLVYENCEHKALDAFVEEIETDGANGVLIHMIDMYPFGDLADARLADGNPFDVAPYFDGNAQIELVYGGGHFSNSRNFVNGLRHRLAPSRINAYVSQKYALFKYQPWLRFSEGIHYAANMRISAHQAYFAHFKYHSEFKSKVVQEVKRKQHFNNAEEYQKYLTMLNESTGCFGAAGVSVRYTDSRSFADAFGRLGVADYSTDSRDSCSEVKAE